MLSVLPAGPPPVITCIKSKTPKAYYFYRGKPLFVHSLDKAKEIAL